MASRNLLNVVRLRFTEARGLRRRPGMAQALDIAGMRLEGRHHSGVDDAWNIAALVLGLAADGDWPEDAQAMRS